MSNCDSFRQIRVHLTDLDTQRLCDNIALNSEVGELVVAQPLRWGDSVQRLAGLPSGPLLLLCADCLLPYDTGAMVQLARSIADGLRTCQGSLCLLAYEERFDVSGFFASLQEHSITWRHVEDSADIGCDKTLHLLELAHGG